MHRVKPNLTDQQLNSIKELRNNNSIIIKLADKGGAVVIMNKDLYVVQAMRQLNNTNYYQPLDAPMYPDTAEKLKDQLIALKCNGFITSKHLSYLQPDVNKMTSRYFYLLPKVHHKPRVKWPHPNMPTGRPIVSDCGSESSKIYESYIQDTYHFINKIKHQIIQPDWLLISADVESLYTNMCINLILDSIRESSRKSLISIGRMMESWTCWRPHSDAMTSSSTVSSSSRSVASPWGASTAPLQRISTYVNSTTGSMYDFPVQPLLYSRFVDDVFAVWPGIRAQLTQYQYFLNSLIPGIKVIFAVRDQIIEFLDTQVYKARNELSQCILQTKVYFKPKDTHQLLHRTSFHPTHTFNGIVKSQFIRFKRISTTYAEYPEACRTLVKVLITRGCNVRELQKMKSEVWRKYADCPNRDNTPEEKREIIPVVTHYDNFHVRINKTWCRIIRKNPVFENVRIISAYKRHKNLPTSL